MNRVLLDELFELLRIPSISSGGGDPKDLRRAAEWIVEKVRRAGGSAEIQETKGNPLAVGRLDASREGAPTVLLYGHYDVQSPEPASEWTSPPFEPTIRDGHVYARGAIDDKGNFFPLLFVACELAEKNELPVNVRVLAEGEEEVGSTNIEEWIRNDQEHADCALIFDSEMLDMSTPALTLGVRGIISVDMRVRTAVQNLHSGLYGGSVLNAVHVAQQILAAVLPGPDGRLRDELREGRAEPTPEELETWADLPSGDSVIREVGGRPVWEGSGRDYYVQNWSDASIDVNGIAGGDAVQKRTIVPAEAQVKLTMRLAPGQDSAKMASVLEGQLRDAAPDNVDLDLELEPSDPALFDPTLPPLKLAAQALEKTFGKPPALIRSGGSLPVLAALSRRGLPTILSGVALPDDNFHAPNERVGLDRLELAEKAAHELFAALANLE